MLFRTWRTPRNGLYELNASTYSHTVVYRTTLGNPTFRIDITAYPNQFFDAKSMSFTHQKYLS